MPKAFDINLDTLTKEEYYNYLVRYYDWHFINGGYKVEDLTAMKKALENY